MRYSLHPDGKSMRQIALLCSFVTLSALACNKDQPAAADDEATDYSPMARPTAPTTGPAPTTRTAAPARSARTSVSAEITTTASRRRRPSCGARTRRSRASSTRPATSTTTASPPRRSSSGSAPTSTRSGWRREHRPRAPRPRREDRRDGNNSPRRPARRHGRRGPLRLPPGRGVYTITVQDDGTYGADPEGYEEAGAGTSTS